MPDNLALLAALMGAPQKKAIGISVSALLRVTNTQRALVLLPQLCESWDTIAKKSGNQRHLVKHAGKIKTMTDRCESVLRELEKAQTVSQVHALAAANSDWLHTQMSSNRKHIGKCANLVARLIGLKLASLSATSPGSETIQPADDAPGVAVAGEKPKDRVPDEDGEERPTGDAKRVRVVSDE